MAAMGTGTFAFPDIPAASFAGVNVWTAASDGDLAKVRIMIDSGAHRADEPDPQGYTCIHAAASYGHHDLLRYLLGQLAVDVNCKDEDGDSPLHNCEDIETAKILLDAGADPSAVNSDGKTPWMIAEEEERAGVCDFLKEACPYSAGHAETSRIGRLHEAAADGRLHEAAADAAQVNITMEQLQALANPHRDAPAEDDDDAPSWEELIAANAAQQAAAQNDAKRRKA